MWRSTLKFSVDWVNVRVDCPSIHEMYSFLESVGFDRSGFMPSQGTQYFYQNGLRYAPAGGKAIFIAYDCDGNGNVPTEPDRLNNMFGILFSISGDGCRWIDSHISGGLRGFLYGLNTWNTNCTRIDVCMDIFDSNNPIVPLFQEFGNVAYDETKGHIAIKCGMKRESGYVTLNPVYDSYKKEYTTNVTIGKRTSAKGQCVCYNKLVEMSTGRMKKEAPFIFEELGVSDYWYRVEYRLKRPDLANYAFQLAVSAPAQAVFSYAVDNLFTFVNQIYDVEHISICPVIEEWKDFADWLREVQNQHFVQLTCVPYVHPDCWRKLRHDLRNAMSWYKLRQIMIKSPEIEKFFIDYCKAKLEQNQDCAQFLSFSESLGEAESKSLFEFVKGLV